MPVPNSDGQPVRDLFGFGVPGSQSPGSAGESHEALPTGQTGIPWAPSTVTVAVPVQSPAAWESAAYNGAGLTTPDGYADTGAGHGSAEHFPHPGAAGDAG